MTETVPPPEATDLALAERVAKLERQVKRLRAKARAEKSVSEMEISPEWEAELERRIRDADENPDDRIPWEVVKAELKAQFGGP
jgi:putative addiction module component (TIGR02574 family)